MSGVRLHVKRIPERLVEGRRLGRHVKHDPRSLSYLVPERDPATLTSVRHERAVPVLDQGNLGSCTGNAAEGCVGTEPFYSTLPGTVPARPTNDAAKDEKQAVALYSAATKLDGYSGSYPPEDTGSDGLSVAKAAQKAGLISGYQHATSLNAALAALAERPVIAGINWYDSFDYPLPSGFMTITDGAQVRGGHEICLDELDVEGQRVGFTNSWGTGWGVQGRGYISWEDFARLLKEDGDVTAFVPLSQPAPTPTPPAPSDPLAELAALLRQLLDSIGTWLKKHGL
jgi:Cysteine protease